ncbi:metallophosphoesterase [Gymnopilus junonius]|uniref:Purple acid phosphatase n=1 Tax=Gymnopilus junonius TaxID=109634 RepID=A0A9P5NFC2_GYMJU|nr:metallophosphoesterase [Gymnopilus junonius]
MASFPLDKYVVGVETLNRRQPLIRVRPTYVAMIPTLLLGFVALADLPSISHVRVPEDPFEPVQIRQAYAGPTGMLVSWNTFSKLPEPPTVQYGFTPHFLPFVSSHKNAESVTYPTSLTFNNHVRLTNLFPNTKYFWRPSFANESSIFSFTTSREAGDHTPFTTAVVVDLGLIGPDGLSTTVGKGAANPLKPGEINTIQSLQQDSNWEFLWHPGDIAYADYWLKEEVQGFLPNTSVADGFHVFESLLNQFYDEMTPITSQKAWMVGPGNHEANCDNGGTHGFDVTICIPGQTNFTGFRNHFRMPSSESETDLGHGLIGPDQPGGEGGEDSGPFGLANQQINWLKNDLKNVDRKKTPWVIAAGHRPWYVSGTACTECQEAFESILNQYSVDLVFSGHFHVFERVAPIFNGTVDLNELNNPKFPWYITNGAAGHYDGLDTLNDVLAPFSRAAIDTDYGWSRLMFHNCTHLTHEFVRSADGAVLDSATLFKDRKCRI